MYNHSVDWALNDNVFLSSFALYDDSITIRLRYEYDTTPEWNENENRKEQIFIEPNTANFV